MQKIGIKTIPVFQALRVQSAKNRASEREGGKGDRIRTVRRKHVLLTVVMLLFVFASGDSHWRKAFFHHRISNYLYFLMTNCCGSQAGSDQLVRALKEKLAVD